MEFTESSSDRIKENGAFMINHYGIVNDLFTVRFDIISAFSFDVKNRLIAESEDDDDSPFCNLHEYIANFINDAISSGKVKINDLMQNASYLMLEPIKEWLEPGISPLMLRVINDHNVVLPDEEYEGVGPLYNTLVYVPAEKQKEDEYNLVYSGIILHDKTNKSIRFMIISGKKDIDMSVLGVFDNIIIGIRTFLHKLNPKNWFKRSLDLHRNTTESMLNILPIFYVHEDTHCLYRADMFPVSHIVVELEVSLDDASITDHTNISSRFV